MITNDGHAAEVELVSDTHPAPLTPVLLNRPLSSPLDGDGSVFKDDRWDLTPAIFGQHTRGSSIPWHGVARRWKLAVKTYVWHLINTDGMGRLANANAQGSKLSPRTIIFATEKLRIVLAWFDAMGITDLREFDKETADKLLTHVLELELSRRRKEQLLTEVQRLWINRDAVQAPLQLPEAPLWDGESASVLVGAGKKASGENARHRIDDATLQPLLVWALRFVEDFASDICAAQQAWAVYDQNRPGRKDRMERGESGTLRLRVEKLIADFADRGRPLPGKLARGELRVDLYHVAAVIGCRPISLQRYEQRLLTCGLPVESEARALARTTGLLDGRPWVEGIAHRDAPTLARHLSTASYIIICYLSGMRPGEVLNLVRGCAVTDDKSGVSTIAGFHFKGVTDSDGSHNPEGEFRDDPWVVHEVAVRAVGVLESLHSNQLLFPMSLRPRVMEQRGNHGAVRRNREGRTDSTLNADICEFIAWVNKYCSENGRPDVIARDRHGSVSGSRFRRTLAWHIVREPRGLIAAAIQYGHVQVAITQAYGGGADSGFADEVAFEDWLLRIETIADIQASIEAGERVSGPAAEELQHRVADADRRFAGRVHPTVRQADKALANPSLQVFKGRGMHCVMNADKAACISTPFRKSDQMTPDLAGCKPLCQNIARTDEDIAELRADAERLEQVASDPLAPAIRTARERAEAERLRQIIGEHEEQAD